MGRIISLRVNFSDICLYAARIQNYNQAYLKIIFIHNSGLIEVEAFNGIRLTIRHITTKKP